jgi:hypothetical protein
MAKTQLNVRVEEETADAARLRASERGISVNRYIEELVREDQGENGRTFVEAAADFMKRYESVFAEEFGREREGNRTAAAAARNGAGAARTAAGTPRSHADRSDAVSTGDAADNARSSPAAGTGARAGARRPDSGRRARGTAKGTGTAA